MASWDQSITAETDWSAVDFQIMFADAFNERALASFPGGHPVGLKPRPTPGTDVQRFQWINDFQSLPHRKLWLVQGYNPDGEIYTPDPAALENVLANTYTMSVSTGEGTMMTAAGYPKGWRRKKPREIISTLVNTDTDGNPAIVGQRAWLTQGIGNGRLCRRTSGGQWQPITPIGPADIPDTLDSDGSAPDRCSPGPCQGGDYIGPWIFNQVRSVYNLMTRSLHLFDEFLSGSDRASRVGFAGMAEVLDFSAAKAKAIAHFNAGGSLHNILGAATAGLNTNSGERFAAQTMRGWSNFIIKLPFHVGRKINWYVGTPEVAPPRFAANWSFHSHGDPVVEGRYSLTGPPDVQAANNGISIIRSPKFFQPDVAPGAWSPDPPTDPPSEWQYAGYVFDQVFATVTWDFHYAVF